MISTEIKTLQIKIKKIVLWLHLSSSLLAGIVIFIMSVTGLLLAYEQQLVERADLSLLSSDKIGSTRQSFDVVIAKTTKRFDAKPLELIARNDISAPYQIRLNQRDVGYVDAYTGEFLGQGADVIRSVFKSIRSWHRWFNFQDDKQIIGKRITGISNVLFLVLLLTGIYIWISQIKLWMQKIERNFTFDFKSLGSKLEKLNWHNVFGVCSLLPLLVVVATAVMISYPTLNTLSTELFIASEIESSGIKDELLETTDVTTKHDAAADKKTLDSIKSDAAKSADLLSLDDLLLKAQAQAKGWKKMSFMLSLDNTDPVAITFSFANTNQPQLQETWYLNPYSGNVETKTRWTDQRIEQRLSKMFGLLHTGEYFGLAGQTIAALVSLSTCVLIWTGFVLAWRRLTGSKKYSM